MELSSLFFHYWPVEHRLEQQQQKSVKATELKWSNINVQLQWCLRNLSGEFT